MAKISTYAVDSSIDPLDILLGSDSENTNLTKNYRISAITAYALGTLVFTEVFTVASTASQDPLSLDTPLTVDFGSAAGSGSDAAMINGAGQTTFNQAGMYFIDVVINASKASGAPNSILLFRMNIGGSQYGTTKLIDLKTTDEIKSYRMTVPVYIDTPATLMTFEVMRDSSGDNSGTLEPVVTGSSWDNVPSAELTITKLEKDPS